MSRKTKLLLSGDSKASKFENDRFRHMKCFDLLRWSDDSGLSRELEQFYKKRIPGVVVLIKSNKPYGLAQAKYIALVYDKQSPFIPEHPVLTDRKKAAASFIGMNEAEYAELRNTCFDLADVKLVDALSDYLKWQDDYTWSMIVQNEEVFFNNQKQILQGVSGESKDTDRLKAAEYQSKLLAINSGIQKQVKALWAEYTGNDPFAEAKLRERKPISPETIAEYEVEGIEYQFDEEE